MTLYRALGATAPNRFELVFLVSVLGATEFGPYAFTLGDVATLNPLLTAAFAAPTAPLRVELRPLGIYTGFTQVRGGQLYIDVAGPQADTDRIPMRAIPGNAVEFTLGEIVTVGASTTPSIGAGIMHHPTAASVPAGFVGLVPMAAQLLRVTAILGDGLYEVEGVRGHINSGVALVKKSVGDAIRPGSVADNPIGYLRGGAIVDDSGLLGGVLWYDPASPVTPPTFPIGSPVYGPNLISLLSDLGPTITNTDFDGEIDAQVGGLVIANSVSLGTLNINMALAVTNYAGGNPFQLTKAIPVGTPGSFDPTNAIAYLIAPVFSPTKVVAELAPEVMSISTAYPPTGP